MNSNTNKFKELPSGKNICYVAGMNNYNTYVFADDFLCKKKIETYMTGDKEAKRLYNTVVKKL